MKQEEININPIVILSLEGVKRALMCQTVINQAKAYSITTTEKDRDFLAAEIIRHCIDNEIPPLDRIYVEIKGGQKGSTKREVLLLLEKIGHRVEMVQELLITAELIYRNNSFSRRIANGTAEFDRLVKWIAAIEDTYEQFTKELPKETTINAQTFYEFFINRSYELVGNRAKLSINNLASVDIQNGVGVNLSKWLRVLSDPYAEHTKFMVREVIQVFKLVGVDLLTNYNHYDRIRGGLEVLLKEYFPKGTEGKEDKLKVYIQAWVLVAFESYDSYAKTIGKEDIKIALGFIGGNTKEGTNTALGRMEAKLNQIRKVRKDSGPETPKMEMKGKKRTTRKIKANF